jgi:hypothetical protein
MEQMGVLHGHLGGADIRIGRVVGVEGGKGRGRSYYG